MFSGLHCLVSGGCSHVWLSSNEERARAPRVCKARRGCQLRSEGGCHEGVLSLQEHRVGCIPIDTAVATLQKRKACRIMQLGMTKKLTVKACAYSIVENVGIFSPANFKTQVHPPLNKIRTTLC